MQKLLLAIALLVSCKSTPEQKSSPSVTSSNENTASVDVVYQAPDSWLAEPANSPLRKAQFRIPGKKGDGEMGVFYFPGAGGSVEANLNRWFGQFKQTDGSDSKAKAKSSSQNINGLTITTVYLTGIYLKPRVPSMMGGPVDETPGYAMQAAIVETPAGPWFFKAVGPQTTIDENQDAFQKLVSSIKVKS